MLCRSCPCKSKRVHPSRGIYGFCGMAAVDECRDARCCACYSGGRRTAAAGHRRHKHGTSSARSAQGAGQVRGALQTSAHALVCLYVCACPPVQGASLRSVCAFVYPDRACMMLHMLPLQLLLLWQGYTTRHEPKAMLFWSAASHRVTLH